MAENVSLAISIPALLNRLLPARIEYCEMKQYAQRWNLLYVQEQARQSALAYAFPREGNLPPVRQHTDQTIIYCQRTSRRKTDGMQKVSG
ncbi:hypothetical protein PDUR_15315 [Paenibacillus durus]|uniref:Uncharacterized protein n=1 Tax=Paenibacillus durus TaxID=44251 RepID=A0A089HMD3_PAEDU|nr:hypothetical protein PDUR_15315 [Paenibacillus durus]